MRKITLKELKRANKRNKQREAERKAMLEKMTPLEREKYEKECMENQVKEFFEYADLRRRANKISDYFN